MATAKRAKTTSASVAPAPAAPVRRRLQADEARKRILDAAEKQLMKVGPEGLRLTDLARALGVSHPAILHHFGNREGLVAAVVRHATNTLNEQLLAALVPGKQGTDRETLMEMVAEVYGERGFARLLAWLMLSGRTSPQRAGAEQPLKRLAEAAHSLRAAHEPDANYDDTLFELQLVAIALLGDAIFGDAIRRASGTAPSPQSSREFRRRLAAWLRERS
jgi:TetR/AcrR family transcriptional regulator, repressor for neighboring sulfatase